MFDPPGKRRRINQRSIFDFACFAAAIAALILAATALTEPWAKGRAFLLFKITRGPGVALVIATAIASVGSAVQALAAPRAGRIVMGLVHTALGISISAVAGLALSTIRSARAGFLVGTVATMNSGRGLRLWMMAGAILLALGLAEIAFARFVESRGRTRAAPPVDQPSRTQEQRVPAAR